MARLLIVTSGGALGGGAMSRLELVSSVRTTHGVTQHIAWSADNSAVFVANGEADDEAIRITASPVAIDKIDTGNRFFWSVSRVGSILVFRSTDVYPTTRYDPTTFATIWSKNPPSNNGRQVITDGTYIYYPGETLPSPPLAGGGGHLVVWDNNGNQLFDVVSADGWGPIFGTAQNVATNRLYIGVQKSGISLGGVYAFNTAPLPAGAPTFIGKFSSNTAEIAVAGTRLWRSSGDNTDNPNVLECWGSIDTTPALLGSYTEPTVGGVTKLWKDKVVNAAGTRLYVAYGPGGPSGGDFSPSGWDIFDTTGPLPVRLTGHTWQNSWPGTQSYIQAHTIALSPDETKIAVGYNAFGVRLFGLLANDVIDASLGAVPTSGELHDVYVDAAGNFYTWNFNNMRTYDPSGKFLSYVPIGGPPTGSSQGGWRPFRGGNLVLPSGQNGSHREYGEIVISAQNGAISFVNSLVTNGTAVNDVIFEEPLLYASHADRFFRVWSVPNPLTGNSTTLVQQSQLDLGATVTNFDSIAKSGNTVWGVASSLSGAALSGVTAIDVTNPAATSIAYQDNYQANGQSCILVDTVSGRVYAASGSRGLRIYKPGSPLSATVLTGVVGGEPSPNLRPNFLDLQVIAGRRYLLVTNLDQQPRGEWVYDITNNPDAPVFVGQTLPENAMFRVRKGTGNTFYAMPLSNVQVWAITPR